MSTETMIKEIESMNLKSIRIFLAVLLLAFVFQSGITLAQDLEPFSAEGIPPGSDYVYRQQYAQVQEILKNPDISAREKNLETFMGKLHEDAKIRQYMEAFFGQIVKDYKAAGQTAKADALTQKMMKWFPKSDSFLPVQFKEAFEAKQYAKAIPLGEKLLEKSPGDAQLLIMLAESYRATNSESKLLQISPKVIDAVGPEKAVNYVFFLADYYRKQKNLDQAINYYDMLLQSYPNRAPQGWTADQWKSVKTTAYQVKAGNAWTQEDFEKVIQYYNEALKVTPKQDGAYLFIGLAHWKLQELEPAQAAFAKAVVLNGQNSSRARQYLETIYKPLNNDSLDGLDKVLADAKSELGI
jgi:tetratricopeptide (TPR) repeat protein